MGSTLYVSNQTGRPFRLETEAAGGTPWEQGAFYLDNTAVAPGEGGSGQTQVPMFVVDRSDKIRHGKEYLTQTTVLTAQGQVVCRFFLRLTGTLLGSDISVQVGSADGSQMTDWFGDGERTIVFDSGRERLRVGATYKDKLGYADVLFHLQLG